MRTTELLIERVRVAAEIYFGSSAEIDLNTMEDCQEVCEKMQISPDDLVAPCSRLWKSILLCKQMHEGSAFFTFRGDSSEEIIHDCVCPMEYK